MRNEADYAMSSAAAAEEVERIPQSEGEYELRAALCAALATAKNRRIPLTERKAAIRSLLAEHLKKS